MNRRLFLVLILATVLFIPGALFADTGACEPKVACGTACTTEKPACAQDCGACEKKCEDKAACCGSEACKANGSCVKPCPPAAACCGSEACKAKGSCVKPCPPAACCGSEACKAKGSCVKPCPTAKKCEKCRKDCGKRARKCAKVCPKNEKKPVCDNGTKACPFLTKIAGEWRGLAETRNDRVQPESLKTVLWIKADGTVTGRLGEWKLKDAVIQRTNDRTRQNLQAEWMITGAAEGMKVVEGGQNKVTITLDVNGTQALGEVRGFAAEKKSGKVIAHRWNLTHLNLYPVK